MIVAEKMEQAEVVIEVEGGSIVVIVVELAVLKSPKSKSSSRRSKVELVPEALI